MPTMTEHHARKARRCGNYPCQHNIEPRQRYRRYTAFPGDDGHEEGTRPWVIELCDGCSTKEDTEGGDYIRSYYKVPAQLRTRIEFEGRPGVVIGFTGHRLLVRLDGDRTARILHPTWRVTYPDNASVGTDR